MKREKLKVSDFANVITGGTPSTTKREYWDGGTIPWLNSGELNQDYVSQTSNFISEAGLKNSAAKMMPIDTVLIALTGATTGKTGYLTFEACANQSVTGILPSEKHYPKYLYHYLSSIRAKILSDSYGGAQKHISQQYVKDLQIPLPPLPIQKQIADTLDKADALRKKDQELLQKYNELGQTIFYEMFGDPVKNERGWEVLPLAEMIEIKPVSIAPEKIKGQKYVGLEHIEKETGIITSADSLDLKSNKFLFDDRNILYGKLRPYLKKVGLPSFSGVCSTDIYPILCTSANKLFITQILRSKNFTDYTTGASVGANLPRIGKSALLSYQTIFPPMKLQDLFSKRIQQVEEQKKIVYINKNNSDLLFKSLLTKFLY